MLVSFAQTPAPPAPQVPVPPALPGPFPQIVGVGDLTAMQTQLAELNVQRLGLKAQWNGLQRQLESMLITNPARPPVQAKAADVGVQLAQIDGQIAVLQARIAREQGRPVATSGVPTPPAARRGPDLTVISGLTLVMFMVVGFPLSVAWARRIVRGAPKSRSPDADQVAPRLGRLEQAVDTIAIEIERISESQRFMTRIMAERAASAAAQAAASPAAAGVDMSSEPMRALGAGPMEPIRMPERQAVAPSITPH
jgi:hypothetical protein